MVWTPYPHGLGNSSSPCCYGNALQFVIYIVGLNFGKNFLLFSWKEFSEYKSDRCGSWWGYKKGATSKNIKH